MLYLASRSPRRAKLLAMLGVDYTVVDVEVDESVLTGEPARDYVERVARMKACAGQKSVGGGNTILAADTTVSLDQQLFGKPADFADAERMLRALSGRWHDVHTALVMIDEHSAQTCKVVSAQVEFADLPDATIAAYWRTGEPQDKAGSYAIQGLGGAFVRRLEGSYSGVVGLPMTETCAMLAATGIRSILSA